MIWAVAILVSAAVSLALTPCARFLAERLGVLDMPAARKPHRCATARSGGPAIIVAAFGGIAAAALLVPDARLVGAFSGQVMAVLAGALLVFLVGLWDDVHGSSPLIRVAIETAAALLVIASGVTIQRVTFAGATMDIGAFSTPITLLWIVVITNAFNLIDGLDGLAGGLAVIAAATCMIILTARGHVVEGIILAALLGALLGFLPYNFHPASIFLGDSGSLVVGFLLAATAITGWQKGTTVLASGVPLLIFAIPIVDVIAAVVRRMARRPQPASGDLPLAGAKRIFEPDREHIHHRLLAMGLKQRGAVLTLYVLSLALAGLALLTFESK